ncbi:MAG TPA: DUF5329 domain-containing protein [Telluria sp.]|nr:DUF5329 domain-containing protein [Telluria sp.]
MKLQIGKAAIAAALMFSACGPALAQVSAVTQREIAHLLAYVASPGCEFNRNGTWYKGSKAREHLKEKYDYLERRRMLTNAESFIERAASTSSMSGKPYLVRCGGGAATPSATWLTNELKRYRGASGNGAS